MTNLAPWNSSWKNHMATEIAQNPLSLWILPSHLDSGPRKAEFLTKGKIVDVFCKQISRWACCTSVWRLWTMDLAVHSAREVPTWEPLLCVIKGRVNGKRQLGKNALQVLALWSQGCHGDFVPSNFMSHFAMSLLIQFSTPLWSYQGLIIRAFPLTPWESFELEGT